MECLAGSVYIIVASCVCMQNILEHRLALINTHTHTTHTHHHITHTQTHPNTHSPTHTHTHTQKKDETQERFRPQGTTDNNENTAASCTRGRVHSLTSNSALLTHNNKHYECCLYFSAVASRV